MTQPLRAFQIGDGIGEFGRAAYRRHRPGAAHGVDEVVVVQRGARGKPHPPVGGVDAVSAVDDQPDSVTEQRAVVDGRCGGVGDQLVQADSLDEDRTRVHHGDVDVRAQAQMIGGQCSGVSTADDDDTSGLVGHCCLLVLSGLVPLRHRRLAARDNLGRDCELSHSLGAHTPFGANTELLT